MSPDPDRDADSLPLAHLERLDELCTSFDDACRAGTPPEIEPLLSQVPESLRERLLIELITLDRDHRGVRAERVDWQTYLDRFPTFRTAITRAFSGPAPDAESGRGSGLDGHWSVAELPSGARVGPYRIEQWIGRGGMGVVYRATRMEPYRKPVALKILRVPADRLLRKWFTIERQLHAQLEHAHIVRLLDGGTTPEGAPYLVMEYVDGARIDQHCRDRSLDLRARVALMLQVAQGVAYAHQRQVIHRDLKPGNVLVGSDGMPRITDFGLARSLEPLEGQSAPTETAGFGTPRYMAPEQIAGGPARLLPTVDCYGLGAILYELSTGQPCYHDVATDQVNRISLERDPTPPRRLDPLIPRDLETIILRALARDPADRFASAAEMVDQLQRFLEDRPLTIQRVSAGAHLAKWVSRHRVGVSVWAVSTLALLLGTIAIQIQQKQRAQDQAAGLGKVLDGIRLVSEKLTLKLPLNSPALTDYFQDVVEVFDREGQTPDLASEVPFRHQWAQAHFHLGHTLIDQNWHAHPKARSEYDRAIELLRTVVRDAPDRRFARYDLARSLACRGMLWGPQPPTQLDPSEADLTESLQTFRGLVEIDPSNLDWRNAEVDQALRLSEFLLSGRSDPQAARRLLDQAREQIRSIVASRPDSALYGKTLGQLELRASNAAWALDEPEAAIAALRRSIAAFDEVLARAPADRPVRLEALESWGNLAALLGTLGRRAEQTDCLAELGRRCTELERDEPLNADLKAMHLWVDQLIAQGQLPANADQATTEAATEAFRALIARADRLRRDFPGASTIRHHWARLLVDAPIASLRSPGTALEILPQLGAQKDLMTPVWLGLALCRQGRFQDARRLAEPYAAVAYSEVRAPYTYLLAWCHAATGELEPARAALARAEAAHRLFYWNAVHYGGLRDEVRRVVAGLVEHPRPAQVP